MELNENPMVREQFLKDGYLMSYSGMPINKYPKPIEVPFKTIFDELPALLHPAKVYEKRGH